MQIRMLFAYNTNMSSVSEANNLEKELQRAISQQQNVQIIYIGSNNKATQRTIRPIEVVGNRLKAYCLTRKAPTVFAIGNILAIQPVVSDRAV